MTHEQAQKILDRVRDGESYSRAIIDAALWLTGDLDAHEAMRGEGMDQTLPGQSAAGWCRASESMVAQANFGYRAHPWAGRGH